MINLNSTNNVKLVNCTPHEINVYATDDTEFDNVKYIVKLKDANAVPQYTLPAADFAARCRRKDAETVFIGKYNTPLVDMGFSRIEMLPQPADGIFYIVSAIVAQAGKMEGRTDLLIPYKLVRNGEGMVIGCTSFCFA